MTTGSWQLLLLRNMTIFFFYMLAHEYEKSFFVILLNACYGDSLRVG